MLQVQEQQTGPSNVGMPGATIPMGVRILAVALRALFIGALVAVTVRVSSPAERKSCVRPRDPRRSHLGRRRGGRADRIP